MHRLATHGRFGLVGVCLGPALWLGAIVYGFDRLYTYASVPGAAGKPKEKIAPNGKFRLMMFIHPQCPCTVAALDELARLQGRLGGRLEVKLLLFEPAKKPEGWTLGTVVERAKQIPGATLSADKNGQQAEAFGGFTSGYALLYDPDGKLVYRGGMTMGRGHEGGNAGSEAIYDWVTRGRGATSAPVFGCAIVAGKQ